MMNKDPIVEEVRKHRREILESYDWDYRKMMRDVMKRQWESGHKVVAPKRRADKIGEASNPYPKHPES